MDLGFSNSVGVLAQGVQGLRVNDGTSRPLVESLGSQRAGTPQYGAGSGAGTPITLGTPATLGQTALSQQPLSTQVSSLTQVPPIQQVLPMSQWAYVDTQGKVQGPAATSSMSQWFLAGYFPPTLQVCRLDTSPEPFGLNGKFMPLSELMMRLNNYQDPFTGFDHMLTIFASMNTGWNSNTGANPQMAPIEVATPPTLVSNSTATVTQSVDMPPNNDPFNHSDNTINSSTGSSLQQQLSNIELKEPVKPKANLHTGDYTLDELLNLKCHDGYYREVAVEVPTSRAMVRKLGELDEIPDNACIVNDESTGISTEPRIIKVGQSQDEVTTHEPKTARDIKQNGKLTKKPKTKKDKAKDEDLRENKALNMAEQLLKEELLEKQRKDKKKSKKQQQQQQQQKPSNVELEYEKTSHKEIDMAEPPKPKVASSTAPWANSTKDLPVTQNTSIGDLKKQNELDARRKKAELERQNRESLARLQQELLEEERRERERKSVLSWAEKKPSSPVFAATTDLKKEIARSTKKNPDAVKHNVRDTTPKEFEDPTFVEEQKRIWEQVQRGSKPSVPTAGANGTNAWTTVTAKATKQKPENLPNMAVNQPKSYIKPDQLRAISKPAANPTKQIGSSTSIATLKNRLPALQNRATTYPGNASVSTRQEFLKWCKAQMKLNPGVQTMDVLEVLLSLPASNESREIIADTIYSNSSTMDGRRFAQEFIKRRQECEKLITDPLSWSEALALPDGNEEDWEFQVVSKKKGRRH